MDTCSKDAAQVFRTAGPQHLGDRFGGDPPNFRFFSETVCDSTKSRGYPIDKSSQMW